MSKNRRGCGCLSCGGCLAGGAALAGLLAVFIGVPLGFWVSASMRERVTAESVAPGRFIQADGIAIHVMEWGPEDGPLVLMVPGTSAWSATWVELATPLAERGHRVVALDLPPFGYTERPSDQDYSRTAQARRILGVLEVFEAKQAVLIGHSFGGGATAEAAMGAPEGSLSTLVLVDPALALGEANSPLAPVATVPLFREPLVAMTFSNPAFLPYGVRSMIYDPADATAERVDRYRAPLVVQDTTPAIGAWVHELLAPAPSRAGDAESYRELQVPTALIWGAEDTVTPVSQGEALLALLPEGTLTTLPGVGHIPQIEDPEALALAVFAVIPPPP